MSLHQEQARDLIDLVADAMDSHDDRKDQYAAGRQIVLSYSLINPHRPYAMQQASLYVVRRLDLDRV